MKVPTDIMFYHWATRFLLFLLCLPCLATDRFQIHSDGSQQKQPDSRNVTFVNQRQHGECGLYWSGKLGSGPRLFYGPLAPNGGSRSVEGFPEQVFVLVQAGTLERLAEYTISQEGFQQQFTITDADVEAARENQQKQDSSENHLAATTCRLASSSCEDCMDTLGCGWSVVRNKCFLVHPIATTNIKQECTDFASMPDSGSKSVDAWLNQANALMLGETETGLPYALRMAYRVLEKATERAEKADSLSQKKVKVAMVELSAKLEAVLDEQDAKELLDKSRHKALAEIHPDMPMVDRRTLAQAQSYISQGKPVVVTDAFAQANAETSPIAHKWTLEYLYRRMFSATADAKPSFNVATDLYGRCCRYFEPQKDAQKKGYPYPFQPSTHLYRDNFEGFVQTVRKAARSYPKQPRLLHYLHEIVLNAQGKAVVAGGPAPPQLVADLDAVTFILQAIASNQPFFGGFASAKLWMGQKGIIMPMHYDATDNLYVMAWGRKRAVIGPPGQLDTLYRYPNHGHPLVGSSQVNISAPDLERFPRFPQAQLQEVIVGPGDVLYLPAWWWHQFEQPFEDTAALNLWSRDRDMAPEESLRDLRIREHALYDQLERAVVQLFGNQTGLVLDDLAQNGDRDGDVQSTRAKNALKAAGNAWNEWVVTMPGGHPKASQPVEQLVAEYLETQLGVLKEARWADWVPGRAWDLSETAVLPRDLRDRCQSAPETSPFMSLCG
jgi:Cupin-like domain